MLKQKGFGLYVEGEDGEFRAVNDEDDSHIAFHENYNHDNHNNVQNASSSTSSGRKRRRGGASAAPKKKRVKKQSPMLQYHTHPTILVEIPGFDCVRDVILDFMHFVLSGVFKTMLERWLGKSLTDKSKYKLSPGDIELINLRLIKAREYCPSEFARQPDPLTNLGSYKAAQYRVLLLYLGVVVFLGIVSETQLKHFHLLVVSMRFMC